MDRLNGKGSPKESGLQTPPTGESSPGSHK